MKRKIYIHTYIHTYIHICTDLNREFMQIINEVFFLYLNYGLFFLFVCLLGFSIFFFNKPKKKKKKNKTKKKPDWTPRKKPKNHRFLGWIDIIHWLKRLIYKLFRGSILFDMGLFCYMFITFWADRNHNIILEDKPTSCDYTLIQYIIRGYLCAMLCFFFLPFFIFNNIQFYFNTKLAPLNFKYSWSVPGAIGLTINWYISELWYLILFVGEV